MTRQKDSKNKECRIKMCKLRKLNRSEIYTETMYTLSVRPIADSDKSIIAATDFPRFFRAIEQR